MDTQSEYLFKDTAKLNVFAPDKQKVCLTRVASMTAACPDQPWCSNLCNAVDL